MSSPVEYEFDVCLSFAGEQRPYVEEVAALLRANGIRPFYDKYERANLWGKDLYEHLDSVYREKAQFCIIFISEDYARKVWTSHERKAAQTRALHNSIEYVLPVRFDDTEIPGIRPTLGHIDARSTKASELVELIREKLDNLASKRQREGASNEYKPLAIPRTPAEQQLLAQAKPDGWEYLLFGGIILQGKNSLQPKDRDHFLRYARPTRHIANDKEAVEYIAEASFRGSRMLEDGLMKIFESSAQDWAFGPSGEPGNMDNIVHLAQRFVGILEDLYDWSADLQGTSTSPEVRHVFSLAARLMDKPISQVNRFIDQYEESLQSFSDQPTNEGVHITLELDLTVDDQLSNEIHEELMKIQLAAE
jgi:hypothetical protein